MDNDDIKELEDTMAHALREIEMLRRVNEVLEAKVSTMNLFAAALHSYPPGHNTCGMAEDNVTAKLRRSLGGLAQHITVPGE